MTALSPSPTSPPSSTTSSPNNPTRPPRAQPCWRAGRLCRPVVSIHPSTQGATCPVGRRSATVQCVRPSRHNSISMMPVSFTIHAPTQGATLLLEFYYQPVVVSIHALTQGATANSGKYQSVLSFQSTRPHRARLIVRMYSARVAAFQSMRPRRARYQGAVHRRAFVPVSIHAPTQGATSSSSVTGVTFVWFQSTRPRRARLSICFTFFATCNVSIHAPTQGATLQCHAIVFSLGLFQSTHPRRARLQHD